MADSNGIAGTSSSDEAASEQASPAICFSAMIFITTGRFDLSYGFEYAAELETSKENTQFNLTITTRTSGI